MADLIYAGMTGAQFLTAMNHKKIYNVLEYGAVGDNNTVNTTELQALIEIVKVAGGTIYFPSGIYKTGKLTVYENITIQGDGLGSCLMSINAEPLLESLYTSYPTFDISINNIQLHGASTGTIGFNTSKLNVLKMNDVYIVGFMTCGLKLLGTLVSTFNNCEFATNVISIIEDAATSGGYGAANLNTFKSCHFYSNTKYAIQHNGGLLIGLFNCTFEGNGTSADITTGAIYFKGAAGVSGKGNVGLIIDSSWFEANLGIIVNLEEPTSGIKQISTISNSIFIANSSASLEIQIIGASTENKLILNTSGLQGDASIIMTGTSAKLINNQSEISGTITGTGVATGYYTVIPTLVQ